VGVKLGGTGVPVGVLVKTAVQVEVGVEEAVGVKLGVALGVRLAVELGVAVAEETVTVAPETGSPLNCAASPFVPEAPVTLKL